MTTDLLEWTPADSKALDAYARSIPGRPPLQPDPHLAELLQPLRSTRTRNLKPGTPCNTCQRPMRPNGMTLEQSPGTVRHSGLGICDTCRWRQRRDTK